MPTFWKIICWWSSGFSQRSDPSSSSQPIILTHKYVVGLFAFLISVDLIEIVGVLCYQLFTTNYFPWHLYPMMLNRAAELLSLICSRGQIIWAYSIAQIILSALSLTVYSKKQPCGKYNCAAPLILYCILLSYEMFVAVIVGKVSRMPMADDDGNMVANWPPQNVSPAAASQGRQARQMGIQIIGVSPRRMRARVISQLVPTDGDHEEESRPTLRKMMGMESSRGDVILAVQQPDGEKIAIAKLCKEPIIMFENTTNCCNHELRHSFDPCTLPSTRDAKEHMIQSSQDTMQTIEQTDLVLEVESPAITESNAGDHVEQNILEECVVAQENSDVELEIFEESFLPGTS